MSNPSIGKTFTVSSGRNVEGQKIIVYGPGGVGKTELASNMKHIGMRPLWLDVGNSSKFQDIERVNDLSDWNDLRAVLHSHELIKQYDAIVIDDLSSAQDWAEAWTCENVKDEKGNFHRSISKYPYGKGYEYNYDTFMCLLGDLDAVSRLGVHIIAIAHECITKAPNPHGEDYIRYMPRLQETDKGKSSIRSRMKEWCDHLLFIGYDIAIGEDGKGKGQGTRAIYGSEFPTHWAKTREAFDPMVYEKGSSEIWSHLFNKGE